jgi:hypothetical protein
VVHDDDTVASRVYVELDAVCAELERPPEAWEGVLGVFSGRSSVTDPRWSYRAIFSHLVQSCPPPFCCRKGAKG